MAATFLVASQRSRSAGWEERLVVVSMAMTSAAPV